MIVGDEHIMLLTQGFINKLKYSLPKFYGRYHELVELCTVSNSISLMTRDLFVL